MSADGMAVRCVVCDDRGCEFCPRVELEGVLLDGAVPHSPEERVRILVGYLSGLSEEAAELFRFDLEHGTESGPGTGGEWNEAEDEIISSINANLPGELICTCGAVEPGTVTVTRMEEESDG